MHHSMIRSLDKVWLFFFAWLIVGCTGLYYMKYGKLELFDPRGKLATASSSMEFDREVETYFKAKFETISRVVFHVQNNECSCNIFSEGHIIELNELFKENSYTVEYLLVEDFPSVAAFIPSSPSIIIFDSSGKLRYLGPYSAGAFCSTSNSFLSRFANNIIEGSYKGAYVIHDAYGCYCLNT